jgi:hypothetical protein
MFRPNWPSSGVQVVLVKYSAAHCNAVFFPPTVDASGYFGYKANGNPHNQNNHRQLQENGTTVSSRILNCNMYM